MAKRKFELPGIQDFSKEQEKVRAPGEYKLSVKGGSTYLEVPGIPKTAPDVDRDRFLSLLADARPDGETEAKVRRTLQG